MNYRDISRRDFLNSLKYGFISTCLLSEASKASKASKADWGVYPPSLNLSNSKKTPPFQSEPRILPNEYSWPPIIIFGTSTHSDKFNHFRVYDKKDLQRKLLTNSTSPIIFSSRFVGFKGINIPSDWKMIPSHTEVIPIIGSERNRELKSLSINEIKKEETSVSNIYINGNPEKFVPMEKYLKSMNINVKALGFKKVDGYSELDKALKLDKDAIAFGYRESSFQDKKIVNLSTGDKNKSFGLLINHTLFIKEDDSSDLLNDFESNVMESYVTDYNAGGGNLLPLFNASK